MLCCRKRFVDIKKNFKKKLQDIHKHASGTGGGPPADHLRLTFLEEQLSAKIPEVQVSGLQGNLDIGVYDEIETQECETVNNDPDIRDQFVQELQDPASPITVQVHEDAHNMSTSNEVPGGSGINNIDPLHVVPAVSSTDANPNLHLQHLAAMDRAEQRLLESHGERHHELMLVQQSILTEIVKIGHHLENHVTHMDTLNKTMAQILAMVAMHNELSRSQLQASFVPPTYVATLQGHEVEQLITDVPTCQKEQITGTYENIIDRTEVQEHDTIFVNENTQGLDTKIFNTETNIEVPGPSHLYTVVSQDVAHDTGRIMDNTGNADLSDVGPLTHKPGKGKKKKHKKNKHILGTKYVKCSSSGLTRLVFTSQQ